MISVNFSHVSLRLDQAEAGGYLFQDLVARLDLKPGEILGLMGESGAGKSTLLRLIARLVSPTSGTVSLHGVEKGRLAFLPQGGVLLEHMSIEENLRLFSRLGATRRRFDEKKLSAAVETLAIGPLIGEQRSVQSLSGGERQRISLARMLAVNPSLVLLDEPCAAIGGDHRTDFLSALKLAAHELGFAGVLASHEWHEHKLVADRVAFMKRDRRAGLGRIPVHSVKELGENPWHQQAVAYTSDGPMNWVEGQRDHSGLWSMSIGGKSLPPARLEPELVGHTQAIFACAPEQFSRAPGGQDSFANVGASDLYGFVSAGEKVVVVPSTVATATGKLRVRGSLRAYSKTDGELISSTTATPTG